jgi:hypothetical protein
MLGARGRLKETMPELEVVRANVLMRCRDGILLDHGSRWVFARQRGTGGGFGVFVLVLVGSMLSFGAIVELMRHVWLGSGVILAVVFGIAGPLLLLEARREVVKIRRARVRAPIEPVFVLDFEHGVARDREGRVVAPLAEVSFEMLGRVWEKQQALLCVWNSGSIVLFETLIFEGFAAAALPLLRRRGLTVALDSAWFRS